MTYREHIQQLKKQFDDLYDAAGRLRDVADEDEKKIWNVMRFLNQTGSVALDKLDNSLPDERAQMELDNVKEQDNA